MNTLVLQSGKCKTQVDRFHRLTGSLVTRWNFAAQPGLENHFWLDGTVAHLNKSYNKVGGTYVHQSMHNSFL